MGIQLISGNFTVIESEELFVIFKRIKLCYDYHI